MEAVAYNLQVNEMPAAKKDRHLSAVPSPEVYSGHVTWRIDKAPTGYILSCFQQNNRLLSMETFEYRDKWDPAISFLGGGAYKRAVDQISANSNNISHRRYNQWDADVSGIPLPKKTRNWRPEGMSKADREFWEEYLKENKPKSK